jgi:hypothetical protein
MAAAAFLILNGLAQIKCISFRSRTAYKKHYFMQASAFFLTLMAYRDCPEASRLGLHGILVPNEENPSSAPGRPYIRHVRSGCGRATSAAPSSGLE